MIIGLTVIFSSWGCQTTKGPSQKILALENKMDSIKALYVPDRRTQIFDYSLTDDGKQISGQTSNPASYDAVIQLGNRHSGIRTDSFRLVKPAGIAIINVSVGNIRSKPGHSNELSTQALMGQQVKVWDRQGYWYYIQTPDEYLGWIDAGALTMVDDAGLEDYKSDEKVMYREDFGFCYSGPHLRSAVVTDLTAGNILRQTGTDQGMAKVLLPDGRAGYVPQNTVVPLNLLERNDVPDWISIEKTARQYLGRPYLWGGTSGKGVDCSGFTKMVYYLNGLELPRDASQQVREGMEIPLDDRLTRVEPGDFLFFGDKGEDGKPDRVTHVAIYLGDGKIIHSSERVQIQSLYEEDEDYVPDRKATLLTAKRMISHPDLETELQQIKNDPGYGF